jgi:cytochrome c oxidase cbb3-type subunit 4
MEEFVNNMRSILAVVSLLCFLGICYWAWSRHAKAGFDEAAQLPLTDDDPPASPADRKE